MIAVHVAFTPFWDATDSTMSSVMADDPLVVSQLCIPDVKQATEAVEHQFAPNTDCTNSWGSCSLPPSPMSFTSWAGDLNVPLPPQSCHVFTCYKHI